MRTKIAAYRQIVAARLPTDLFDHANSPFGTPLADTLTQRKRSIAR